MPSWAALLQRFYAGTGLCAPVLTELKPAEVPPPYQGLLVHSSDMTPTLARFYGQSLGLRVLSRERQDDSYKREVILWLAEDARPVEYGVIRIRLDRLPPAARRLVLEEQRPLGDILQGEAIPHLSWPQAFFRLKADAHAGAALGLRRAGFLYGRRNVLLDGSRRLLAEVIEVLAPVAKPETAASWRKPKVRATPANGSHADENHRSLRRLQLAKIRT
jgi:chorismate-pyruvate lyase